MKKNNIVISSILIAMVSVSPLVTAAIEVNPKNFSRAESDLYMAGQVKAGAFGKLAHTREVASVKDQQVIRLNRDTLYTAGLFDLDAGPVTITLPDSGKRFMSLQAISEDHYTVDVIYDNKPHTFTRANVGTRYVLLGVRTFVDPLDAKDLREAQKLQDSIKYNQVNGPGKFEVPEWDQASQTKVRKALLSLNDTLDSTNGMFGKKAEVDPVLHLIGSASAWGGNPQKDATYLNVTPEKNDGKTIYKLKVGAVPVKSFWSISVYNSQGYYEPNALNSYNLNSQTSKKSNDGTTEIQFGGCTAKSINCLPIVDGWNYMVRLYRPDASILDGTWKFPVAQPVSN